MNTMRSLEMYLVFSLIIYLFEVLARQDKSYIKSMIVSFVLGNVINLEAITKLFNTHFLEVFLFEILMAVVTLVLNKITQAFSNMNSKVVLFIVEVVVALGLCFIYYYAGAYLEKLV